MNWLVLVIGVSTVLGGNLGINMRIRHSREAAQANSTASLFELALFGALPDAIIAVEPDHGNIVYANARACDLTGWTREDLIGQTVDRLVPEDIRSVHSNYRRLFAGDPSARRMAPGRALRLRCKDGTLIPVDIRLNGISTLAGRLTVAQVSDMRTADERHP